MISNKTRYLNYIICGLYLFYVGSLLNKYIFIDNKMLTQPFLLLGLLLTICGFYKTKKTLLGIDQSIIPIYCFFMLIGVVNALLGVLLLVSDGKVGPWLYDKQKMWMYLIGFSLLIPMTFLKIRVMICWALLYVVTSLAYALYNFGDFYLHPTQIVSFITSGFDYYVMDRPQEPGLLLVPIGAFLILFSYFSKKWRLLIVVAFVLAILAALLQGRRTASITTLCYPFMAILLYAKEKGSRVVTLIMVSILSLFIVSQLFSFKNMDRFFEKNFVVLAGRYDQDTRKDVDNDFYKDMKESSDWIIGRGMEGTYKSVELSLLDKLNRKVVETGYLNIILHGGLLMLIPYVILLLYAFFMGYFKSNNLFVKACATYVLFHFILLYPSGHLRLTFECFILFGFMRICMTKSWREMSNEAIREHLYNILPQFILK